MEKRATLPAEITELLALDIDGDIHLSQEEARGYIDDFETCDGLEVKDGFISPYEMIEFKRLTGSPGLLRSSLSALAASRTTGTNLSQQEFTLRYELFATGVPPNHLNNFIFYTRGFPDDLRLEALSRFNEILRGVTKEVMETIGAALPGFMPRPASSKEVDATYYLKGLVMTYLELQKIKGSNDPAIARGLIEGVLSHIGELDILAKGIEEELEWYEKNDVPAGVSEAFISRMMGRPLWSPEFKEWFRYDSGRELVESAIFGPDKWRDTAFPPRAEIGGDRYFHEKMMAGLVTLVSARLPAEGRSRPAQIVMDILSHNKAPFYRLFDNGIGAGQIFELITDERGKLNQAQLEAFLWVDTVPVVVDAIRCGADTNFLRGMLRDHNALKLMSREMKKGHTSWYDAEFVLGDIYEQKADERLDDFYGRIRYRRGMFALHRSLGELKLGKNEAVRIFRAAYENEKEENDTSIFMEGMAFVIDTLLSAGIEGQAIGKILTDIIATGNPYDVIASARNNILSLSRAYSIKPANVYDTLIEVQNDSNPLYVLGLDIHDIIELGRMWGWPLDDATRFCKALKAQNLVYEANRLISNSVNDVSSVLVANSPEGLYSLITTTMEFFEISHIGRLSFNTIEAMWRKGDPRRKFAVIDMAEADDDGAFYDLFVSAEEYIAMGYDIDIREVNSKPGILAHMKERAARRAVDVWHVVGHGDPLGVELGRSEGGSSSLDMDDDELIGEIKGYLSPGAQIVLNACQTAKRATGRYESFAEWLFMELKRKVFASPVRGNMERIVFADDGSVDGVRFVKMATGRNHEKVFSNKKR